VVLVNPNNPNAEPDTKDVQAAVADSLGRELRVFRAGTERELETASQTFSHAYSRYFSLMISNGLVHPPPDLSQVPGGAGVPPPTG
jgi:hypothetical protein